MIFTSWVDFHQQDVDFSVMIFRFDRISSIDTGEFEVAGKDCRSQEKDQERKK
jgi:hypothetical protein